MFTTWCLLIGLLLIGVGLTDTVRRDLPFSASALYLVVGWLLGPQMAGLLSLDLVADAPLLERLAETAVLISLFAVGLRLRVRLSDRLWTAPVRLATVAMLLTIGLMTAAGVAFGLPLAPALLLAAVLAPTDPVLASDVQVEDVGDRDRLRFSLTGEGGLNDGTAFPFVMLALGLLGLHELGTGGWRWWAVDLLWAVAGGLAIGWSLGFGFARAVMHLRREREQAFGMESFLTLGLIALTYGCALLVHAYGFLAVFAAGLAMRHVERRDTGPRNDPGAEAGAPQSSAYMAKAVLDFTLDLEKLAELAVMLLIGSLLRADHFHPVSLGLAAILLFVARPLAVGLTTIRSDLTPTQRRLAAWFGVRGIGSMYYLAFALARGAGSAPVQQVADAVLVAIVASVVLHGASATPAMRRYAGRRRRRDHAAGP